MDALYHDGLTVWPGMTIFWIGDLAHQGEVSGHNPDDTPRVQAEQTDADNDPEVRALDFMLGSKFSAEGARELVEALIRGVAKRRLYYVIYNRRIYRRATGFVPEPYSGGDPHTNHVHVSGHASDDENGAPWTSVLALAEEDDMPLTDADVKKVVTGVWSYNAGTSHAVTRAIDRLNEIYATVTAIAGKVDLDPAELAAIQASVQAGMLASADEFAAAVLAQLPAGNTLTKGDVEAAVRTVFADAGAD